MTTQDKKIVWKNTVEDGAIPAFDYSDLVQEYKKKDKRLEQFLTIQDRKDKFVSEIMNINDRAFQVKQTVYCHDLAKYVQIANYKSDANTYDVRIIDPTKAE